MWVTIATGARVTPGIPGRVQRVALQCEGWIDALDATGARLTGPVPAALLVVAFA